MNTIQSVIFNLIAAFIVGFIAQYTVSRYTGDTNLAYVTYVLVGLLVYYTGRLEDKLR